MKAFKQTYLCLSAQPYSMTAEDTGAILEGVSLWYLPDDNLDPEDERNERGEVRSYGKKVAKMSLPLAARDKLAAFPGLYDITFEMATVAQKQQVRAKEIQFASAVRLERVQQPKPGGGA